MRVGQSLQQVLFFIYEFQSAFTNFVSDEFRTLPDMDDRWVSSLKNKQKTSLIGLSPQWWPQIGHMAGLDFPLENDLLIFSSSALTPLWTLMLPMQRF